MWSVWLIAFECMEGEAWDGMKVLSLKGVKHGGWHWREACRMAVEDAVCGVCELVELW